MRHLGNFRQRLLGLAVTLAVVGGCAEPEAPPHEGPRGTTSAALELKAPELVRDLRTVATSNLGSAPSNLVAVGNTLFFVAHEAGSGRELWKSDGTAAGTQLVRDIRPGVPDSAPGDLTVVGGQVYFTADDGSRGRELWRTDGTADGTVLVKDFMPGSTASNPGSLKVFNGVLYLQARDPVAGAELWRTDGTAEGTVLVKDIVAGTLGGVPQDLTVAGNTLFFTATTSATGRELWKSDGTADGTMLVKEVDPGTRSGFVNQLTAVGNSVFFVGREPTALRAIWTSDGTEQGTRLVHDPTPGDPYDNAAIDSLTAMGGTLYFVSVGTIGTTRIGYELWATEGASTRLVRDLAPGSLSSSWPSQLRVIGNVLFFQANDPNLGIELWKTDGTEAGTQLVSDVSPGSPSSNPMNLTHVGGVLYFTAEDGVTGRELWKSDGTPSGTLRVKDLRPGVTGATPEALTAVGNALFLSADNGALGLELWRSDGSDPGTSLVKDIRIGTADSDPQALIAFNGSLFFSADVEGLGREPWLCDGTAPGTRLLQDVYAGVRSSSVSPMAAMNGALLFGAHNGVNGMELWTSDGTSQGTRLLRDIQPGSASGSPSDLQFLGGRVYFKANDGQTGIEPWTSDGTSDGTRLLRDINVAGTSGNSGFGPRIAFKDRVYFGASNGTGTTLWRTDGTTEGTVSLANVVPYFYGEAAATPDFFYFTGAGGNSNDVELWKSDGTAAGTQLIRNINAGQASWPDNLTLIGQVLYFSAIENGSTLRGLWRSDGTQAGTWLVKQLPAEQGNFNPANLTVLNGVLLFQAYDPEGGTELWRSDGTLEGTRRVRDIHPGPVGGVANQPMLVLKQEGLVVFAASDGTSGMEPWISDGTEAGTRRLGDLAPGAYSSTPRLFTRVGEDVYFVANDGTTGFELWRVTLAVPPDTTPPTVTCPASLSVEVQSTSGAPVSYPPATVTDNAPGLPTLAYSQASGTVFPFGATVVTVTATDAAGNAASCTFNVTVQDTTGPSLTCPAPLTVEATDSTGALVSYPAATVSDIGSAPEVTYSQASGTLFSIGVTAVTVTATDAAGNTSSCTFNVTVRDATAPDVTCPANVISEATGPSGAQVSYPPATASDGTSPPVTLSYSQASGTVFPLGQTVVTATATDATGNSATCSFSVTVRDTLAPVLACPTDVIAEATGAAGASVSYPPATASDAVTASPVLTYSQASGTAFSLGTTGVTVTARDAAGNTASCAFNVTVRDATAPSVSCPTDRTVEATASSGATVGYPPATAADAVTDAPVLTYSQASGTTFPLGTTSVRVTATDAAGNASTCDFNVTVQDTTRPELTCPANVVAEATGASGASVSYPAATASDAVTASPVLTSSRASGSVFPLGVTAVTLTATDAAGNAASCTFDVTVRDTTAPALSCPGDVTGEATSSTGATVSYPAATASDAVTASPALTYSQASGTLFPMGATVVTVTATDAAGNAATCSFRVTVRDDTRPTVSCPTSVTAEATGASGATVSYPPATASDSGTGSPSIGYSHASGALFPLGVTTVTATATDATGNSASCTFEVIVRDTTAPGLTCPAGAVAEATSASGATVEYAPAVASDAVSASPELVYSHASGTVFPAGATQVTVTARDASGNESTCHFTLRVRDTTAPSVGCTADLTVEADGADGASVAYELASPLDSVTRAPRVSVTHASDSRFPLGTTPVTVTARDDADNEASCTFSITVRDTTPPAVTCPADLTVQTQDGGDVAATFAATAADAVTGAPELTYSHASGSLFPRGTTSVTVTARDEAGLTAACTFQVTVRKVISVPEPDDELGFGCSTGASGGGSSVWFLLLGSALWFQRRTRVR
ncbi:ELWxxDGT repeat protein [Pyxidicoccus sp. 3LFB2]